MSYRIPGRVEMPESFTDAVATATKHGIREIHRMHPVEPNAVAVYTRRSDGLYRYSVQRTRTVVTAEWT